MTAASLTPDPIFKAFDNNGAPLAGGKLFTYKAGTSTKLATYTDSTAVTPNTNPVILNSRGEANVWIPSNVAYKYVLSPSTDTDPPTSPIWTIDQVSNTNVVTLYGGVDGGSANAYTLSFTASFASYTDGIVIYFWPANTNTGASTLNINGLGVVPIVNLDGTALTASEIIVNQPAGVMYKGGSFYLLTWTSMYTPGFTGSVTRTVKAKLQESVSVKDFGAAGDGVTDDTAAIQAAITAVGTSGKALLFPAGTYKWTGDLTPGSVVSGQKCVWRGEGWLTKLQASDSTSRILITNQATLNDMWILGSSAVAGAYVGTGVQIGSTNFTGQVELNNVRVRNFATGVRFAAALWTTLNKCTIDYNGVGCDFNAGSVSMYSTTVAFRECNIANNDKQGIASSYVPHPNLAINIYGGSIQENGSLTPGTYPQAVLGGSTGVCFDGVYFENSVATLNVDASNISGFVFKGNFIQGGTIGLQATSAALKDAVISGNYFSGLTGAYSINVTGGTNVNAFSNQLSAATSNVVTGTNCNDADTNPFALRYKTEGTFTPTIQGTLVAGSNTYTSQTGYYNQIGNVIFFRGRITMSVKDGAMAGNVQIALNGLPNSLASSQAYSLVQITPNSGVTFSGGGQMLVGEISSAVTNLIDIQQVGSSGELNLPVTGIAAGLTLRYSGYYVVAG